MFGHPLVVKARQFAMERHQDQFRKYTGEPYWHHCHNVATLVMNKAGEDDPHLPVLMASAYLHDTIEDTDTDPEEIMNLFPQCYQLVCALTDYYTSKTFPDKNRAWRKEAEAIRLGVMAKILPGLGLIK